MSALAAIERNLVKLEEAVLAKGDGNAHGLIGKIRELLNWLGHHGDVQEVLPKQGVLSEDTPPKETSALDPLGVVGQVNTDANAEGQGPTKPTSKFNT